MSPLSKFIKNGTVVAVCMLALAACNKKKDSKGPANTTPIKDTAETCAAKSGYQWDGVSCVVSTAENNQVLCEQAGRVWQNDICLASNTTYVPTAIDACSDMLTLGGNLACLDARTNELESHIRGKPTTLSWVGGAISDMEVIRKNYNQLRGKNISESSNFTQKFSACSDIYVMAVQSAQINFRLNSASDQADAATIAPYLQNFNTATTSTRKLIGCP